MFLQVDMKILYVNRKYIQLNLQSADIFFMSNVNVRELHEDVHLLPRVHDCVRVRVRDRDCAHDQLEIEIEIRVQYVKHIRTAIITHVNMQITIVCSEYRPHGM